MWPQLKTKKTPKCVPVPVPVIALGNQEIRIVMFCAVILSYRHDLHTLPEGSVMTTVVLPCIRCFPKWDTFDLCCDGLFLLRKCPCRNKTFWVEGKNRKAAAPSVLCKKKKVGSFFTKEPRVWEYLSTVQHLFPLKIISGLHDPQTDSCFTERVQKTAFF